jgi:hypothetical protein
MAAGSLVGSFIDGRLPGMIPYAVLLPHTDIYFDAFSDQCLATQMAAPCL